MGTWKAAPAGLVWCLAVCCAVSGLSLNCAAELPDSPGATVSQSQTAPEQRNDQKSDQKNDPSPDADAKTGNGNTLAQASSPQTAPAQSQEPPAQTGQKPVGTAAAGSVPTTGVAASQPAGTAIAPGKQRRVRSLVIKMGAIIGAGVAVGTVAALTLGTPSKPPGAH
jgi:hypothetical protein